MMMAHESGPPSASRLNDETVTQVRGALTRYLGAPSDADELREALRLMADEARTNAILPEQLLVTLKSLWASLPAVSALDDGSEQTRMLQRVVTMCIKEYYR